ARCLLDDAHDDVGGLEIPQQMLVTEGHSLELTPWLRTEPFVQFLGPRPVVFAAYHPASHQTDESPRFVESGIGESNPSRQLGRLMHGRYANPAALCDKNR